MIRRRRPRGRELLADEVFAKMVAAMGDPEWRRERRVVLALTAVVLAGASALFVLLMPSRWDLFIGFSIAFVVGICIGSAMIKRRYRPRPPLSQRRVHRPDR